MDGLCNRFDENTEMDMARQYDGIVYLFQGGGALGSYQAGVYEGLLDCHFPPDWIIGTSIGAINGSIIAGNKPEHRIQKLKEFWEIVSSPISDFLVATENHHFRKWENIWSAQWALMFGQSGFFKPRLINPWLNLFRLPNEISFYDINDLRKTLEETIDFEIINQKKVRLTLGAVCVDNGDLTYFDNTQMEIKPHHIMASCALPPAFPAVKIDEKYYWDGGISCNTPLGVVLEDKIPQHLLCFIVNLFAKCEVLPNSMLDVIKRRKDLEFSGHYDKMLESFCKIHRLEHTIHQIRLKNKEKMFAHFEHDTKNIEHISKLNLIRFHYRDRPYDVWSKDFEFSRQSIQEHYQSGIDDVQRAINDPKWLAPIPDNQCVLMNNY